MMNQTVTVRRYTTDRYGDRTLESTHTVSGCAFAPRSSRENVDRANQVVSDAELYAPPTADINPGDEIERTDGTRWEVAGLPEDWDSPWTLWQPGLVVPLNRVTG